MYDNHFYFLVSKACVPTVTRLTYMPLKKRRKSLKPEFLLVWFSG